MQKREDIGKKLDVPDLTKDFEGDNGDEPAEALAIPKHVQVFEITGPLFFGAAYKFKDSIRFIEKQPRVLIIRMRKVPIIDATGIKTIRDVCSESKRQGIKVILSEVHSPQLLKELKDAQLLFAIGKTNVTDTFGEAVERSKVLLGEENGPSF